MNKYVQKKVQSFKKTVDISVHEHVNKYVMKMKISILELAKLVTMFIATKNVNINMCDGDKDQYSITYKTCDMFIDMKKCELRKIEFKKVQPCPMHSFPVF